MSFENAPPVAREPRESTSTKHSEPLLPPGARLSESSTSSVGDGLYAVNSGGTAPARGVSRNSGFFRLPRRRPRQPEPLFALSHLPQKSKPNAQRNIMISHSSLHVPNSIGTASTIPQRESQDLDGTTNNSPPPSGQDGISSATQSSSIMFPQRPTASPATALFRPDSIHSAQSSPTRARLALRGRSSTMSSAGRDSMDEHVGPSTGRSSTSAGRQSFGDLLGLSRFRQNSDQLSVRQGATTPLSPGSNPSKNNSLQLPRESATLPERQEDDTPAKYLVKVEQVMPRSLIASALSKGTDSFHQTVLRSYMRRFSFFGDPMDMSIRKLLMEAELPKETQQIDRCLQSFANRYHECNPGIYASPDQAYFIAFSLLILHTDVFNKNNRYKMQKSDYLKNTQGEGVFDEILECFYDNITYTPFIHVEEEFDMNGERIVSHKGKKKPMFPNTTPDGGKKISYKEPIDPYALILDKKLDVLRPGLKDIMELEEHYSYLGSASSLNLGDLQKTFFRTGVLQIISARSRPDAFMTEKTANNPEAAHPGIVDIKITKAGLLWRKDAKKKKTRSPWQEWGAILTGAQLYFFRNVSWVKNLIHQYENHIKQGNDGIPCVFKPPLENFKPDGLMSTEGAVALIDSTYKKHKYAFVYVRQAGLEEVLLAEDENQRNDWLSKLNYAAAFRTSGVRMRGVVGGHYEVQSRRGFRMLDNSDGTQSMQTSTGEVTIARSRIDHKMAQDILSARRDVMSEKIMEANQKLEVAEKQLSMLLTNSRHLHVLAPIQQKTRDQVIMSAKRLATQLKAKRVDMWRLRCHRDILQLDLEEDQKLNVLPPDTPPRPSSVFDKPTLSPLETKIGGHAITERSPQTPVTCSVTQASTTDSADAADSPAVEVLRTPSIVKTGPSHNKQPSLELSPSAYIDPSWIRSGSTSSRASSITGSYMTPPLTSVPADPTIVESVNQRGQSDCDDIDAQERNLLKQTGLIGAPTNYHGYSKSNNEDVEDGPPRQERPNSASAEKTDKNKIRRSLHRTVREGVGHLSHHRNRRGRDSVSSSTALDDPRDETLIRASGSFVVHGKKASVINFGSELQIVSPEGRLRQHRSQKENSSVPSPCLISRDPISHDEDEDFKSVVWDPLSIDQRPRRESAASGSTATARSFRELHRKYSSTQASKGIIAGGLSVPADDDSDAAISFSEGRRTPLLPIEGEPELETGTEKDHAKDKGFKGKESDVDKEDAEADVKIDYDQSGGKVRFFTSEETAKSVDAESSQARPPIQTVTA